MYWYLEALKNYARFGGRARRKEYWFFVLFNILFSIILGVLDGIIGTFNPQAGMGMLGGLYGLAIIIPSIAVGIRRLHDTNRSGWWLLISLVPILGFIVLLVFMLQDSAEGDNQYGPNPKEIDF